MCRKISQSNSSRICATPLFVIMVKCTRDEWWICPVLLSRWKQPTRKRFTKLQTFVKWWSAPKAKILGHCVERQPIWTTGPVLVQTRSKRGIKFASLPSTRSRSAFCGHSFRFQFIMLLHVADVWWLPMVARVLDGSFFTWWHSVGCVCFVNRRCTWGPWCTKAIFGENNAFRNLLTYPTVMTGFHVSFWVP